MDWYYMESGERKGPVSLDAIKELVKGGELGHDSYIWNSNMGEQWARVSDVPILSGPQTTSVDPKQNEEFKQKLAERQAVERRRKRMRIAAGAAMLAVFAGLIWGSVRWVQTKQIRRWGISARHPMGQFERFDGFFMNELQMEKETLTECPEVTKPFRSAYRYSKPRAPRGEHMSAAGSAVVMVDESGEVVGVLVSFPSPGIRGALIINRSFMSNFALDYWGAFWGKEDRVYRPPQQMPPEIMADTGFRSLPSPAYFLGFTKPGVRGVWMEYGQYAATSLVHIHRLSK